MEPHGTSLEERNDIMNEPRDCTTCQHQGQDLKKEKEKEKLLNQNQIAINQSNNDRQHKDDRAIDGDQLRLTHPWMSSMTISCPKKAI